MGKPDQKAWKNAETEVEECILKIFDALEAIHGEEGWVNDWYDKRREIKERLEASGETFITLRQYVAYYGLFGGTTDIKETPKIDLPGELSIIKQLQDYRKELELIVAKKRKSSKQ
jgi:hypothetical protein